MSMVLNIVILTHLIFLLASIYITFTQVRTTMCHSYFSSFQWRQLSLLEQENEAYFVIQQQTPYFLITTSYAQCGRADPEIL